MTVPGGHERVLAIRLDTIGDVIMTTPALGAMAEASAEVTLLTSSFSRSLAPMLPYLRDVIPLDVPWMKPAEKHLDPSGSHLATLDRLREREFDLAVVFTVSTQDPSCAAYLAYLCGIPKIAAHVRGKLYGLVTHPVFDTDEWPPTRHEVRRQIDLVSALGYTTEDTRLRLELPTPTRRAQAIADQLGSQPWCLMHPGATAPSRRYPNRLWARVADLLEQRGIRVVLAGGKHDRARCADLAHRCSVPPVRVDARLALPELATVMAAAPVAVTCNSAAAHLASAFDTPLVTLYAGTNPQHTPWTERATVLRRDTECTWCLSSTCCHHAPICIASLEPEVVADAVTAQLARASGSVLLGKGLATVTTR